jgi:hypothetical protein
MSGSSGGGMSGTGGGAGAGGSSAGAHGSSGGGCAVGPRVRSGDLAAAALLTALIVTTLVIRRRRWSARAVWSSGSRSPRSGR